jgi:hypothetical protein
MVRPGEIHRCRELPGEDAYFLAVEGAIGAPSRNDLGHRRGVTVQGWNNDGLAGRAFGQARDNFVH